MLPPSSTRTWEAVQWLWLALLFAIASGTALLLLPGMTPPGPRLRWADAFLTSTSAVCGSGLSPRDPGQGFTPAGQAVLGLLVQSGGLTVSVFAVLVLWPILRQWGGDDPALAHTALGGRGLVARIAAIVALVLGIEILGAVLLYHFWPALPLDPIQDDPPTAAGRAGLGLFHAVGAFCGSGFTLVPPAPEFRYAGIVHLVILPLAALGSLGVPLLLECAEAVRARVRGDAAAAAAALSWFSRVALGMTAGLYLAALVALVAAQLMPYLNSSLKLGMEYPQTQPHFDASVVGVQLVDASHAAITAGNGGLGTLPPDRLRPAAQFALLLRAVVGGAPTGTGGGITVLALAVLLSTTAAAWRGHPHTEPDPDTRPGAAGRHALLAVAVTLLGLIALATLLLSYTEPYPLARLLFATGSAAAGADVSLGITPDLTSGGKGVLAAVMIFGRLLPLALLALAGSSGQWSVSSGQEQKRRA